MNRVCKWDRNRFLSFAIACEDRVSLNTVIYIFVLGCLCIHYGFIYIHFTPVSYDFYNSFENAVVFNYKLREI